MELNWNVLALLYLAYSFLGWVCETVTATVRGRSFVNRGFASGPCCFLYGFTAVLLAVGLHDLRTNPVMLFLGSMAAATTVEWLAAKLIERLSLARWWDYSDKKFNLDGYVCLEFSLLWGALGTASVLWGNRLLLWLYGLLPGWVARPVIWVLLAVALLDQAGSVVLIRHTAAQHPRLEQLNLALARRTDRLRLRIEAHVERRIQRAYPTSVRRADAAAAAPTLSLSDLLWLFVIGALLGDVVETLYCRAVGGVWMSRSSLVWGPFSIVWGLALALATVLLHRGSEGRSDRSIFAFGFVLGGVYEYICSAVGELLFGVVFWDYSGFMFNLGGRINLLYCLFWGIAAVVWLRYGLPLVKALLRRTRRWVRPWMTALLAVFMAVNMLTSALALARYNARMEGLPATTRLEQTLDARFGDARMERIYPNAKKR